MNPYKNTAQQYGVSEKEVIEEINKAISMTYENPTDFAKLISPEGEVPTSDGLIAYICNYVLSRYVLGS